MKASAHSSAFMRRARPRRASLAVVAIAHVLIIYLFTLSPAREAISKASIIMVTLIREQPRAQARLTELSKPFPFKLPQISVEPAPLVPISLIADITAIPVATPRSQPVVATVIADSRVEPPRFDVAYLNNPTPIYPALSKRLHEQGKVLLRVRVSATGTAEQIEIQMSSGASRLDNAAVDAVRQWRFVPARRGDDAMTGWALVPINFHLA